MTRDLDTHWKFHWVMVNRQGLGGWMSFRTWIRLTAHGVVIDCDLGKVRVYTPSKGCVRLGVYGLYTGIRGHAASMRPGS